MGKCILKITTFKMNGLMRWKWALSQNISTGNISNEHYHYHHLFVNFSVMCQKLTNTYMVYSVHNTGFKHKKKKIVIQSQNDHL